MTKNEMKKVIAGEGSKSAKMIALYNAGVEIKEIATEMGVRYNFVYNVVSNNCRMNGIELRTQKRGDGNAKKDLVIKMLKEGKAPTAISAELQTHINYIYKIRKELEAQA